MKALLLAAGVGSRLGDLTKKTPKPMIKINGIPILEQNIILLRKFGVKEILVNLHHLPEVIKNHFKDGSKWGTKINYFYEKKLLGTSGTLRKLKDYFDEDFLVMYGDNLFHKNLNLNLFLDFHNKKKSDFTIGLCQVDDISLSGLIKTDKNKKVKKIIEKPKTNRVTKGWVNAGLYLINPTLINLIPRGNSDFSYDFIPILLQYDYNLYTYELEKKVVPIDTPARLRSASS